MTVIESPHPESANFGKRPRTGRLLSVFLGMFVAQGAGSVFNITYNLTHLAPLFTERQRESFQEAIGVYNGIAYPIFVTLWAIAVFRLRRLPLTPEALHRRQKAVIHLPLTASVLAACGWGFCIPSLFYGVLRAGDRINPHIYFHLPVSLLVAMVISLALGYFLIDWLRQKLLFPYFFREVSPGRIEGAFRISIVDRGRIWTLAASICPILALLLLLISPAPEGSNLWFAVFVAASGILTALVSSILMSRLVLNPVDELRHAAQEVGRGNLNTRIGNLHADEFGILADEFNAMVAGLREKERVTETFGRHVGREIARELLKAEEELKGVERVLSVLFADLRGFTTRCETLAPADAVKLLNLYHEHMTRVIESQGGIVNQLIGDGIMALFGATGIHPGHAGSAVAAASGMVSSLDELNERLREAGFEPVRIGIGINTGPAVVGTIGSPRRMEYTAIGDTVNTAARIEGMTKELGGPILISEATWTLSNPKPAGNRHPAVQIRGRRDEIVLYSVRI